jgi:hypothetical protein
LSPKTSGSRITTPGIDVVVRFMVKPSLEKQ